MVPCNIIQCQIITSDWLDQLTDFVVVVVVVFIISEGKVCVKEQFVIIHQKSEKFCMVFLYDNPNKRNVSI